MDKVSNHFATHHFSPCWTLKEVVSKSKSMMEIATKHPFFSSRAVQLCGNVVCIAQRAGNAPRNHGCNIINDQVTVLSRTSWRYYYILKNRRRTYISCSHWNVLLSNAGITLNLEKCKWFKCKIDFLEHVVWLGNLKWIEHTSDAIFHLRTLRNAT